MFSLLVVKMSCRLFFRLADINNAARSGAAASSNSSNALMIVCPSIGGHVSLYSSRLQTGDDAVGVDLLAWTVIQGGVER